MAKKVELAEDEKVLQIVEKSLDDNKAERVEVLDLRGKTSIASFMVVASGTSQRHVASLAEHVHQDLKKLGYKSQVEGEEKADWVLIDAYDVIVHIFKPEVREFYNIEKMWKAHTVAKAAKETKIKKVAEEKTPAATKAPAKKVATPKAPVKKVAVKKAPAKRVAVKKAANE